MDAKRQKELITSLIMRNTHRFMAMPLRDQYHIYLMSPRWQKIRLKVLKRDKDLCQICRIAKANQVHHVSYERCGKENLNDLLSVCSTCHRSIDVQKLPRIPRSKKQPRIQYYIHGALADYLVQTIGFTYLETQAIFINIPPKLKQWTDIGDYLT